VVEQPGQLGRDRCLLAGHAAGFGLPPQPGEPGAASAQIRLLASQIGVELAEDPGEIPVRVAGQRGAHLVQAQAELG
jgi:hypothetical protein